ncbi:MAG: cupin domain-containing protein [Candidatus Nomurabacteria bacterium]|nr:cupin domain-containing protein [Candidatus Nomurabacteria bacterium]
MQENFEQLFQNEKIQVKKITSPAGFTSEVFTSDMDEWIYVIRGSARLDVGGEMINLKSGEHFLIPKNTSNQVLQTLEETTWLGTYIK